MRDFLLGSATGLLVATAPLPAAGAAAPQQAAVTYVTTATAYVDAGTEAGLRLGDVLEVRRDGALVTWLEVTALSSKRASCRRREPDVEIRAGDRVTFRTSDPAAPTAASSSDHLAGSVALPEAASARPRSRDRRLRGRIDFRYLGLVDGTSFDRGYSEPGVDVRVDGGLGGGVRVSVDARARRTYRPDDNEGRTRVYRALAEWGRPATGAHAALGRQVSPSLTSVGVFDGAVVEWRNSTWGVGAFSGLQPDSRSFGVSSEIHQHGAFVERGGSSGAGGLWRVTLAAIGSYAGPTIDREYLALQGRLSGRRLEGYAVQEVDLARGWKADAGEDRLTLTSSLVNGRWRFAERWSLTGGTDTRRNVRSWRDHVTPETEFDDDYRTGHWGGLEVRPGRRASIGADFRRSSGGSGGEARAFTLRARGGTARLRNLDGRARGTRYESDRTEGWLVSGGVGVDITPRLRAGVTLGRRLERILATGVDGDLVWVSGELDAVLPGGWLLLTSVERSEGEAEHTTQIHASAGWRF